MSSKWNRNKIKGQRFGKVVRSDVKRELIQQAELILTALRFKSRLNPEKKVALLTQFFRKHPGLNPLEDLDTYGVEQVLNMIAQDGKEATAAKRLYNSMMDTYIKKKNVDESLNNIETVREENMKSQVTREQILEMVNKSIEKRLNSKALNESIEDELLPGDDKIGDYMEKVEKFVDEFVERAEELAQEGEEMIKTDFAKNQHVAERNRMILTVIGFMRKHKFNIAALMLDLRKAFG